MIGAHARVQAHLFRVVVPVNPAGIYAFLFKTS